MSAGLSLRDAWNQSYADYGPMSEGLYQGGYRTNPSAFPFRSLRRLIQAARWPTVRDGQGLRFVGQHPEHLVDEWTDQNQGLAVNETFWFSTQTAPNGDCKENTGRGTLNRIARDVALAETRDRDVVRTMDVISLLDAGMTFPGHLGALVESKGLLYVAVENAQWRAESGALTCPAQVWVLDPVMRSPESLVLDAMEIKAPSTGAPWCAVNDDADLLYTSDPFGDAPGVQDQIRIYRLMRRRWIPATKDAHGNETPGYWKRGELEGHGALSLRNEDGSPFQAWMVQAAIVTPNGHLLLVSDAPSDDPRSGLHLFDLVTGIRRSRTAWVGVTSSYLTDPNVLTGGAAEAATRLVADMYTRGMRYLRPWSDGVTLRATDLKLDEAEAVAIADAEGFYVHVLFCVKNWSKQLDGGLDGAKVLRYDTFDPSERPLL